MSVLKPSDLSKEKGHFESQRQYKARVFWIVLSITQGNYQLETYLGLDTILAWRQLEHFNCHIN